MCLTTKLTFNINTTKLLRKHKVLSDSSCGLFSYIHMKCYSNCGICESSVNSTTALVKSRSSVATQQARVFKNILLPTKAVNRFMSLLNNSVAGATKNSNCLNINNDYDIIGFDLDGTILRYNLNEMVALEYNELAKYLVNKKQYPNEILKPIDNDLDFLQKGLILDSENGNILKLNAAGNILLASHGTNMLNENEIINIYGANKKWEISTKYVEDPLSVWNGPHSVKIRASLDYFDVPAILLMARAVDAINARTPNKCDRKYDVYPDILDGLVYLYGRDGFKSGKSEYFEALKSQPERYLTKTRPAVIEWLKELKKTKAVFLLTGSNIDFANFTASYALGPDWKDLFDAVVAFARKPGFFTDQRIFYNVIDNTEGCEINEADIKLGNCYTQGNWKALEKLLSTKFNVCNPRSVYIGDNLIQDVHAPDKYGKLDTIAVVEELFHEKPNEYCDNIQKYEKITKSKIWGSYFNINNSSTFWNDIIIKQSKLCVPTVDYLSKK